MKNSKKLASLLLALTMLFCMATTAFAAETTGSITLDNPTAGETYTAYKIFDVVYNEAKTAYSYTISSNSEWYTTVSSYATAANGLTLTASATDATVYIVEVTSEFSAAAFANALKAAATGKSGTPLTETTVDGKTVAKAENLSLGYYFVTSTTGALCNLTTTDADAVIHDKNEITFKKTVSDNNPEVGQTVNFVLVGKVPDTTGFTSYTYEIADTMSDGLTFQKDVKVYVGGTVTIGDDGAVTVNNNGTELSTEHYTLTNNTEGIGFTLSIDVMEIQDNVTDWIVVTYSATVNEKAIAKIDENNATLKYSNDPTDEENTSTITEKEKLFTAKIVIDKFAADATDSTADNPRLAGAKFVLYKKNSDGSISYYKYTAPVPADGDTPAVEAKIEWYKLGTNDTLASAIASGKITEVTTDEKGAANFGGLENGTYYLHETESPAGYNLLKTDVQVDINGNDDEETSLSVEAEIANNTGSELPETGGMGTTLFYVLGGVLVLAAIVLLVTKKRMSTTE